MPITSWEHIFIPAYIPQPLFIILTIPLKGNQCLLPNYLQIENVNYV